MKELGFWLVFFVMLLGLSELVSRIGLGILARTGDLGPGPAFELSAQQVEALERFQRDDTRYLGFDPVLGWSIKPNGTEGLYRANAAGIRASRELTPRPRKALTRISTFGDSFTHGDEVANDDTWQSELERLDPVLEVPNFGVAGFGLDQAYLRYLAMRERFVSDVVLIGYMSENLNRNVNTFRPFYYPETEMPLAKPRFVIEDGVLTLVPSPIRSLDDYRALLARPRQVLPSLGANDYFYARRYRASPLDASATLGLLRQLLHRLGWGRTAGEAIFVEGRYNPRSEAFEVTLRLIEAFYEQVLEDGAVPIVVIFPNEGDVERYRERGFRRYAPLIQQLEQRGRRAIDVMPAFDGADLEDAFDGHYSPHGNALVARYLHARLAEMHARGVW